MSAGLAALAAQEGFADAARRPSRLARAWNMARTYPLGVFSIVVLLLFVATGLFGPALAPYNPRALQVGPQLGGLSGAHWFGSNALGQDVFSRVLAGARVSLLIGASSVLIGGGAGALIGMLSGFRGGALDFTLQRAGEAFIAFPSLVLYLLLTTAFGRGPLTIVVALSIGALFGGHRLLRAAALTERFSPYIEAERAIGASETRVFLRHIVPNVLPLTVVLMSGLLGGAILAESALAFLGLGVAPGTPSWGIDMSGQNLAFAREGHWNLVVFPGIAISLVVLAANLLGDTLRDIWDPRLRGKS